MTNSSPGGKRIPSDPRAVCNLMLDLADRDAIPITNLVLQKLLYFAHAIHLTETKTPLVSGYFEAWQYGPVHPIAYRAFAFARRAPIGFRAQRENLLTGERSPLLNPDDPAVSLLLRRILINYGRIDPSRLIAIAHAKKAPWHFIVDKAGTQVVLGMRIPDDVILDRFKYHKVSIDEAPIGGEIVENRPFAELGHGACSAAGD